MAILHYEKKGREVMVYTYPLIIGQGRQISECEADLVYRINTRKATAIQGNRFETSEKER